MTCSTHDTLARLLLEAGQSVLLNGSEAGEDLVRRRWPHLKATRTRRTISDRQKLKIFKADGFRCRYTGDLLFFSGYLTALSALWPETFPAHPHGKSDEAHEAYWTHFASVEHLDPVSMGGAETEDNWITTSMARNQVRSRYSLEALGWKVLPRNPMADWEGGVRAFLEILDAYPSALAGVNGQYLKRWRAVVIAG
ncbi:hypothetical protein GIW81_06140 [Hyphomicrobium sp. xq]|uniref:Uncharacterized protein n=1 Tax=Hyphomicrobium album TaxID=2665159 RepID=A0A6I3KG71_9HYPH|nr:hypothetical protein [Hyphomicrobium album]MTD93914.1 hypothetical protein [Hyphomicrobium album]